MSNVAANTSNNNGKLDVLEERIKSMQNRMDMATATAIKWRSKMHAMDEKIVWAEKQISNGVELINGIMKQSHNGPSRDAEGGIAQQFRNEIECIRRETADKLGVMSKIINELAKANEGDKERQHRTYAYGTEVGPPTTVLNGLGPTPEQQQQPQRQQGHQHSRGGSWTQVFHGVRAEKREATCDFGIPVHHDRVKTSGHARAAHDTTGNQWNNQLAYNEIVENTRYNQKIIAHSTGDKWEQNQRDGQTTATAAAAAVESPPGIGHYSRIGYDAPNGKNSYQGPEKRMLDRKMSKKNLACLKEIKINSCSGQ